MTQNYDIAHENKHQRYKSIKAEVNPGPDISDEELVAFRIVTFSPRFITKHLRTYSKVNCDENMEGEW